MKSFTYIVVLSATALFAFLAPLRGENGGRRIERVPTLSLKTNILVMPVANLGFEAGFGNWSLDVPVAYSPYSIKDNFTVKVLGVQPELRFWFRQGRRTGHFIGVHSHIAAFNVRIGDGNRYQDPDRPMWGLGVSYGYSLPLGKNSPWGVEFTLGLGYADIAYDVYDGIPNGRFLYTDRKDWLGPTRAGISIWYRFDL
jgi:hypothetical protein